MQDEPLSPHFSLYQLTRTDHADLQEENRKVPADEKNKLVELAGLLEACREVLGCELDIHSGRRYLALNQRVGGSEKSQHLKCEAADFSPAGPDTEESIVEAWQKIATASRNGKLKFGQLIVECETRKREGRAFWIHISLGRPYREPGRCGEVLSMKDGKFTLLTKLAG
jgi:hypothetical protein